ncbi:YbhB/YbcL family Raf kinase inhibitor-like protein [Marisediminicola senii]|uniref:YbhB/YbcL family Raf kinase inhibitor-like protein n=1 Tax=Marisediminicola senii TaxID=2711233 RepID=UPI0013E9A643|nr:YbhB/YbcL family Raf kinase inhibitor-like protein [Marisediminicola senii]
MANDPNWRLPEAASFTLSSPDVDAGAALPTWARSGIAGAGGDDVSPALHWEGAPEGTRSFALTVYDPDAPTGSGFWHWAVYNIPAGTTSLPRDAGNPGSAGLPDGASVLPNELRLERFLGAAPPAGHGEHRYFFTLTALDVETLELEPGSTPAILGFSMLGHVLGRAQFLATSVTPGE